MNSINVPVQKISYVSFDKEMYEETVYNRMHIYLSCGDGLTASLSFSWKDENTVPTELLEFISSTGIDVNLSDPDEDES
jgi:ferritin